MANTITDVATDFVDTLIHGYSGTDRRCWSCQYFYPAEDVPETCALLDEHQREVGPEHCPIFIKACVEPAVDRFFKIDYDR